MLVELSVVEQRYHAVMEVASGVPVTRVAARYGVSRQSVHSWVRKYERSGLPGLADRSHRPASCPHRTAGEVEATVCELRRRHPSWGPRRLVHELERRGIAPVPSRATVYRVLVRNGLIEPGVRKRHRSDYRASSSQNALPFDASSAGSAEAAPTLASTPSPPSAAPAGAPPNKPPSTATDSAAPIAPETGRRHRRKLKIR